MPATLRVRCEAGADCRASRALLLLSGLLVALVLPAAAAAQPVTVAQSGQLQSGPSLAGASLFYADEQAGHRDVRLASDGSPPQTLATSKLNPIDESEDSPGEYRYEFYTVAASASRLAFRDYFASGNARYGTGTSSIGLSTGAHGGPLAEIERCERGLSLFDLQGQALAYVDCSDRVVVRDFTPGASLPVRALTGPLRNDGYNSLAVAGRFVAFRDSEQSIAVYDWTTDALVYRTPATRENSLADFDLQADGTLATSFVGPDAPGCANGVAEWYSPSQPFPHALPVRPCGWAGRPQGSNSEIRIAGDRIAVVTGAGADRLLTLASLSGERSDVAHLGPAGMQVGDFDFDGSHVAYALRDCEGGAYLLRESAAPSTLRREKSECPVRIRSRRVAAGRARRSVRVSLACSAGCAGRVEIRARPRRGSRSRRLGSREFRLPVSSRCAARGGRVTIPLSRSGRRALRSGGRLSARLRVITSDRNGGRRVTVRRIVVTSSRAVSTSGSRCP